MPLWAVNIALEISVPERRYHSIQDWYARLIWISIPVNIICASQTHATAWSPSWFIRTGHQIQFTESEYWSDLPLNPKDTWLRHYKFTFLTYVSWMPGVVAVLWSLDTHPCACYMTVIGKRVRSSIFTLIELRGWHSSRESFLGFSSYTLIMPCQPKRLGIIFIAGWAAMMLV